MTSCFKKFFSKNKNQQNQQNQQGQDESFIKIINSLNTSLIEENSNEIKKEILDNYSSVQKVFQLSESSHLVSFIVAIASFFSLISNAIYINSYLQQKSNYSQFAKGCDIIAFAIYFLEFIIKLVSESYYYFFSWNNIFNLLLLISFIVPFCITNSMLELAYLSFFRIFQVSTFFSHIPYLSQIEVAHRMVLRNLLSTFIMLILLFIAIFLFALIAYFCFTQNLDSPLKSLYQSIYFLTIEATGGGWTDFQDELDQVFDGARTFSILFIIFTYIIIARGFAAFLADNSIVESRAYIKKKEDIQSSIEEAEKEIRPTEKNITILIDIKKEFTIETSNSINYSQLKRIPISLKESDECCKDFKIQINKYNFWQLHSIKVNIENYPRKKETRIYFLQVLISFEKDLEKNFESQYDYDYSYLKEMKAAYENFKNHNQKNPNYDPDDHSQEIEEISKLMNDMSKSKNKNSSKAKYAAPISNFSDKNDIFCYNFPINNYEDNKEQDKIINVQSTDFQTYTTDYPFYIYYRFVVAINNRVLALPSQLGKVAITVQLNLLGKKRASEITESEEKGLMNQISKYDVKITEEKMLMKSSFWAASLITVLKDYSLHNRIINIFYHKAFQRTIMMCDYMPMIPELIKQENQKSNDNYYDDDDDLYLMLK